MSIPTSYPTELVKRWWFVPPFARNGLKTIILKALPDTSGRFDWSLSLSYDLQHAQTAITAQYSLSKLAVSLVKQKMVLPSRSNL